MVRHPLLRDHLVLLLFCGMLFFPLLGGSVLWDFDEGYFASVAKEMYDNGEWIVPTFSERELGDKPILIFWGMILSFSLFGVNEFAVRLPSILYGTATVLLTYHLVRRMLSHIDKEYNIALRSSFILATMLLFGVETRGTTCDGAMLCWFMAALTVYVYGCKGFRAGFVETPYNSLEERIAPWFPHRWSTAALMNVCLGMAVLAKGPAMAVMGTAVIGLFLLVKAFPGRIDRNPIRWATAFLRICWKMRPITAVLVILAVAGPWFAAVGWKTGGEWWNMFFIEHNFQRSIAPTRGHTGFGLSLLFYPVMTLFGTFPWSVFAVPCLIDLCRRWRLSGEAKNVYSFLLCWIVLYFGLFTLVSTKLPHYVIPAYPALAIILGVYLAHWRCGTDLTKPFWTWFVLATFIVVGIGIITTMRLVLPRYFPDDHITGIAVGLVPLLMGIIGIVAYKQGGRKSLDVVYTLLALIFFCILFQWAAGQITKYALHDREFFQDIESGGSGVPPLVVSIGRDAPSWVFYSGQPIRKIDIETLQKCRSESELRNELIERDKLRPKYLLRLGERRLAEGRLYLIISESDAAGSSIIGGMKEIARMRRFMKNYDQLLLTLP
jgi:4-amino-4-deoxy-L-arabinose transferase-like glycosyltransferase